VEAAERGHRKVQSDHLLAGILADEATPAAALLRANGLTADQVRGSFLPSDPDDEEK